MITTRRLQEILATQVQIKQEVSKMAHIKVENELILKHIQEERQSMKKEMPLIGCHRHKKLARKKTKHGRYCENTEIDSAGANFKKKLPDCNKQILRPRHSSRRNMKKNS